MGRGNPKGEKMQLSNWLSASTAKLTFPIAKNNIRVFLTTSSKDYSFRFHVKITIKSNQKQKKEIKATIHQSKCDENFLNSIMIQKKLFLL